MERLVAHLAEEFDAHQTNLLLGVVATELLNCLFERIALGILLKIEVYVFDLILVHVFVQVVLYVESRA